GLSYSESQEESADEYALAVLVQYDLGSGVALDALKHEGPLSKKIPYLRQHPLTASRFSAIASANVPAPRTQTAGGQRPNSAPAAVPPPPPPRGDASKTATLRRGPAQGNQQGNQYRDISEELLNATKSLKTPPPPAPPPVPEAPPEGEKPNGSVQPGWYLS